MGGAYATAALNIGPAGGPLLAAGTLELDAGDLGPVWGSGLLIAFALLIAAPLGRVVVRVGRAMR